MNNFKMDKRPDIDEIKHDYLLIIIAIIFVFIGVVLIVIGYYSNKQEPGNIRAFLCLNFGSLSIVGASCNLVNDLFLKRGFARRIQGSIDKKLEKISLDETIQKFGLHSIQDPYTKEALWNRITSSSSVLMLGIRNTEFFSYFCPEVRESIKKYNLRLTILMLDPASNAISLLTRKFPDTSIQKLSQSLRDVINTHIKGQIHDKLPKEFRNNLKLYLFDQFPVYSAYVFDDEEMWFVPYYFRCDKRLVPVFIIKGRKLLEENEIYRDIQEIEKSMSVQHDLNKEV